MPAYLIVHVEVTDPETFARDYAPGVAATVEKYGGRYLARGGKMETLEGDWPAHRVVLTEFPTVERAKAWWASEEYRELKAIRHRTAKSNMVVVEGL